MSASRLALTREQILAFRRRVGALDRRLPPGPESLHLAAWAGLQDSMPRAALLSIHARVEGTQPGAWEDPALVQVWGPRFSAYVVAAADVAAFTLGRLPDDPAGRQRAADTAARLHQYLAGRRLQDGEVGRGLGVHPNSLRYAAPTGTVLIRWDGARQPHVWTAPPPEIDPLDARLELARRYLHVMGPGTPASFGDWAGIKPPRAQATFDALAGSMVPVDTPIGAAWLLAADEGVAGTPPGAAEPPASARLLPSGDTFFLLQGAQRQLLVPEANLQARLWTSRVWPGALLVNGEIAGTWRRATTNLTVEPWRRLTTAEVESVEAEAASLPLPGLAGPIVVRWG